MLLATPFARVVALGIAFARRRQWLFAGISFVVMAMLILGAVLGLSLGSRKRSLRFGAPSALR